MLLLSLSLATASQAAPAAVTYYVSSSSGDDDNDGLSESSPFETVSKVNGLNLQPGDRVLFECGDVWRADPLMITQSGAAGQPVTFGSYPAGCADRPVLSGAQPVSGWTLYNGNIYVADLSAGANAGKFGYGVNQLFRGEERLVLGRWPNLDAGDGGYSTIDSDPSENKIGDLQLPAGNWAGAVAHIRGMRWYILNRSVTSSAGTTLTLGANTDCWGECTGWGYFLNNHLNTLDQEGEWHYHAATHRLYLYSESGAPADGEVEGAVILKTGDDFNRAWGGIVLGEDLQDPIAYVTVENLAVRRWFRHGITTPTNLHPTENYNVTLQNNLVSDVDGVGINLATWVWGATDGRPDGWRGGYNQVISGNLIERANSMGINSYARNTIFSDNIIRDIGLIENLGAAGMGCSTSAGGGVCTEDGDGIRIKVDESADSGNNNTLRGNRLERIAYNGMDIFGYSNAIEQNAIVQPCYAKGDCGGVRTFGSESLSNTSVHDLVFSENIIMDVIGNTDGCRSDFDALFGFGLYIDHYSRNITVESNTIISATVHGILYQDSTGVVTDNTLYNNGRAYPYAAAQVFVGDAPASVGAHTGNILYSLDSDARTLSISGLAQLGSSDGNYFFSPYRADHIAAGGDKSLAEWQAYSGKDGSSVEHWFTQSPGEPPLSRIFYNDTSQPQTFGLGKILYADLDRNLVSGSLVLQPYQSRILIETSEGADLAVKLELLGTADTAPSAPLTYTITISNLGIITASPVTLAHPIPAEIVDTSWQASAGVVTVEAGTRYTWEIEALAAGEAIVFTVAGHYVDALEAGAPLLLTVEATTPSPEVEPGNNRDWLFLGEWQPVYLPLIRR